MRITPFYFQIICRTILLLATVKPALTESANATTPDDGRKAWFVISAMPEGLENPVEAISGGFSSKVSLSKRTASQPVGVAADGVVRLVQELPDPDKTGETAVMPLAQVTVPEAVNQALIVLAPAKRGDQDEGPEQSGHLFDAWVIDLGSFREGGFIFINLTVTDIAIALGDKESVIKPKQHVFTGLPGLTEPVSAAIGYSYLNPEREIWHQLGSSTVVLVPGRRELCIFTQDTEFSRIGYHGVTLPNLE